MVVGLYLYLQQAYGQILNDDITDYSPRIFSFLEGNAKCRQLKKLTCKRALRQMFICLRPRTPFPHLPFTHCIRVYCTVHLFTQRSGEGVGGVEPERRGEGQ
jgi:hypothetical protein